MDGQRHDELRNTPLINHVIFCSFAEEFVRTQRNLVQFHNMIKCATGRSSSYYIDYGCYCGYGGKGSPLDDLDR